MTAWGPQGSGAGRSRWLQANRNTAIIVAVAVVLIVLIVLSVALVRYVAGRGVLKGAS